MPEPTQPPKAVASWAARFHTAGIWRAVSHWGYVVPTGIGSVPIRRLRPGTISRRSPEIVRCQRGDSGAGRAGLDDVPDHILGYPVAPYRPVLSNRSEQPATGDWNAFGPPVESPWQRAYVERVIGTIRRECLDHLNRFQRGVSISAREIVSGVLSRIQNAPFVGNNAPEPRPMHQPEGAVVAIPQVGGLHHRYERRAA